MTDKDAERQFEIEASTMDRQQLYNWAKRLWIETARQAVEIERLTNWRAMVANNARPGDIANVILERDELRRELAEARAKAFDLAASQVPNSWLDPLLKDVDLNQDPTERLLEAIRQNILALKKA